MPAIQGIIETALYVDDLARAADFYRRLFSFETLSESDRLVALDVAGRDVLLLFKRGATAEDNRMPNGLIPGHTASGRYHFAFSVAEADMLSWKNILASQGVEIEGTVNWEGGAESIYFRDPDQNLVELLTRDFWRENRRGD